MRLVLAGLALVILAYAIWMGRWYWRILRTSFEEPGPEPQRPEPELIGRHRL